MDFTLFWEGPHIEWEPSRVAHGIAHGVASAWLHDKGGLDPAAGRGGLVAMVAAGSRGGAEIFRNIPGNQWAIGHTSHLTSHVTPHITPHTSPVTLGTPILGLLWLKMEDMALSDLCVSIDSNAAW